MIQAEIKRHIETMRRKLPPSEEGFLSKHTSVITNVETSVINELIIPNLKQQGQQSSCSSFLLVTAVAVLRYLRLNKYALMGCMYIMMISAYGPGLMFAQVSFGCEGQG